MDTKRLEANDKWIIIEKLEEAKVQGAIQVAGEDMAYFARGKVISSGTYEYDEGEEVVFLVDNALKLGLGAPNNVVVLGVDDIVCAINPEEEADEE